MTRDRESRLHVFVDSNRLGRIDMHGMEEPSGSVGPDRDHRHIESAKSLTNFSKGWGITRVSGKVGGTVGTLDDPAAPVGSIAIEKGPSRTVLRR